MAITPVKTATLTNRDARIKGILPHCEKGQGEKEEGKRAAGEETLDSYVKKDLFHCHNQKTSSPRASLRAGKLGGPARCL